MDCVPQQQAASDDVNDVDMLQLVCGTHTLVEICRAT